MRRETVEDILRWQDSLGGGEPIEITFHGGEPLLPGLKFYRTVLPLLRDGLGPRRTSFSIQSNLWLLSDEWCDLFREHGVSLGTSLDGPEEIDDAQRGSGYFRRTMAGIECARRHGLGVGCICTFTASSAPRSQEIFDFFLREGLCFSIHAALPALDSPHDGWSLSPQAHGDLLIDLLDRYLPNADKIRISTLDAMCRSISAGHGGLCTFGDCLGEYMAIDPEGWIYACQRLAGKPAFRLGHVHDAPSMRALSASAAWRLFQDRQARIEEECGECEHLAFCRGGCPYNALVANGGTFHSPRDPHCPAYQRVLSHLTDRAMGEVFSPENLEAVVARGANKHGLLQKGRLLQIMRGGPHPQEIAPQARRVAAAVALAASASPEQAVVKLDRAGLVTDPPRALQSVTSLRDGLRRQSQEYLNAYFHVTYACNLSCDHCYAASSPSRTESMAVDRIVHLVHEAAGAGFRKAIITGGEPMAHPRREAMLDALGEMRGRGTPLQTVLRTNLAYSISPQLLARLAHSTDQVVVSVDGDRAAHDARRGAGTYAHTVENLRALRAAKPSAQIVMAAALSAAQMRGAAGDAVRTLGKELGVSVRSKPVLPLGRAKEQGLEPDFYSSLDEESGESLTDRAKIVSTCGLGMNLYIAPDGRSFPCYALTGARHDLGNAIASGLAAILESPGYQALKRIDVESNARCRGCALRYLCGGMCRAWSASDDPDAAPPDCAALRRRASGLLVAALESLGVSRERWMQAGLFYPE